METKKRVLVVDDEVHILNFVRIGLTLAGYEVITTVSGKEGLWLVEREKPDVILLDIVMAPMDGFEVLERLQAFPQIPVIVFSARSHIAERALRLGASDFVAKPFRPEELERKIKAVLSPHRQAGPGSKVPPRLWSG